MKKSLIFIISYALFFQQIHASQKLMQVVASEDTVSFKDLIGKFNHQISVNSKAENGFKTVSGGLSKAGAFFGLVQVVPLSLAATGLSFAVDGANQLRKLNNHIRGLDSETMFEAIELSLSKLAVVNEERLSKVFLIENDEKRTKELWNLIKNDDLFSSLKQDLEPEVFIKIAQPAIVKLHDYTVELASEINNNAADIGDLKDKYTNLEDRVGKIESNLKSFAKALHKRDKKIDELVESLSDLASKTKSRSIASVEEDLKSSSNGDNSGAVVVVSQSSYQASVEKWKNIAVEAYQYAEVSLTIATNLGLKGKDLERANNVLKYSQATVSVIAAFSGDPMSIMNATAAITGLLGGGGMDPDAQRHAEIMEAFGKVFQNQKLMIENQEKIFKQVIAIRDDLAKYYKKHESWYQNFDTKLDKVLGNQAVALDILRDNNPQVQKMISCQNFLNSRLSSCLADDFRYRHSNLQNCVDDIRRNEEAFKPNDVGSFDVVIGGSYDSYEGIVENLYYGGAKEELAPCLAGLRSILVPNNKYILSKTNIDRNDDFKTAYDSVINSEYIPLLQLYNKFFSSASTNGKDEDRAFSSLYYSLDVTDVGAKNALPTKQINIFDTNKKFDFSKSRNFLNEKLLNLYHTKALNQYISYFLETYYYYYIYDQINEKPYPKQKVMEFLTSSKKRENNYVKSIFLNVLEVIDTALRQQALLSGTQLLPYIKNYLYGNNVSNDETWPAIDKFISSNGHASKNLSVYILHEILKYKRGDSQEIGYSETLNENLQVYNEYISEEFQSCLYDFKEKKYPTSCKSKFIKNFDFPFIIDGREIVFVSVDKQEIRLPLAEIDEVSNNKFFWSNQSRELLILRQKVISELKSNPYVYKEVLNTLSR
ncbi:hypothetical protein [Halobacteriovorax sp. DA5]|uniref:hypothetical protein n=1 Tax=Halobacteriovorax sp. DA5 TaxID=2067553 RepID=UPI000CD0C85B|nr:hypothetical protein [Halobacteriovorax sp. DA5]POB14607.1 hypothetical protein C0Z22_05795 [Halobacteriovorax sp. DA5]